jgi:hypothetical protein
MHGKFDLKLVSNLSKNERRPSNFHEFWSKELHCDQIPLKKYVCILSYLNVTPSVPNYLTFNWDANI